MRKLVAITIACILSVSCMTQEKTKYIEVKDGSIYELSNEAGLECFRIMIAEQARMSYNIREYFEDLIQKPDIKSTYESIKKIPGEEKYRRFYTFMADIVEITGFLAFEKEVKERGRKLTKAEIKNLDISTVIKLSPEIYR